MDVGDGVRGRRGFLLWAPSLEQVHGARSDRGFLSDED
jgi:hypothetical protein